MGKYKQHEIEVSPRLLYKLFEYVRANPSEDFGYIVENLKWYSKCNDMLTLDEYDMIIKKPTPI